MVLNRCTVAQHCTARNVCYLFCNYYAINNIENSTFYLITLTRVPRKFVVYNSVPCTKKPRLYWHYIL